MIQGSAQFRGVCLANMATLALQPLEQRPQARHHIGQGGAVSWVLCPALSAEQEKRR